MVDDRLEERVRSVLRATGGELHLSVTSAELERRLRVRRRARTVQRSVLIAAAVAVLAVGVAASGTWFRSHTNVGATPSPARDVSSAAPSPTLPAVVPPSADASEPIASPDWTRVPLAIRYWTDGNGFAYEIGADGTENHRVPAFDRHMDVPRPAHDVPRSWDGRFFLGDHGGAGGIFGPDGRLVIQVPEADGRSIVQSSWSPTMNILAVWLAKSASHFSPSTAWVLDADHGRVLAGPFDAGTQYDFAWSPDGRSVAVSAKDGLRIVDGTTGAVAIHRSSIDGVTGYVALDWSPDARWILYLPWSGEKNEVDRVAADGTHGKRLSAGWTPVWSPDSSRIAYVRSPTADGGGPEWQIWTMDADGTDRKPLVKDGCPCAAPEWSPDGSLILLQEGSDLWVMTPDGSGARRLARNAFGTWVTP